MTNSFSQPFGGGRSLKRAPLLYADWRRRVTAASVAREALPGAMLFPEPTILPQIAHIWTILGDRTNGADRPDTLLCESSSSEGDKAALVLVRKVCMQARHAWDCESALTDCLRELVRRQEGLGPKPLRGEEGELDAEEQRFFELMDLEDKYSSALCTFQELALAWGRLADLLGEEGGRLSEIARTSLSLCYSLSYACEVQKGRVLQWATFVQQQFIECQWERMDLLYSLEDEASSSSGPREDEEDDGPKLFEISDAQLAAHIQEIEQKKVETEQMGGQLPLEAIGFSDQLLAEIEEHLELCKIEQTRRKMLLLTGELVMQQARRSQHAPLKLHEGSDRQRQALILQVVSGLRARRSEILGGYIEVHQLARLIELLGDASVFLLGFSFSCGSGKQEAQS